MLFSGMRWLYTLILDVLLRSGFGLAVKLVPFYAFYVLPLSLIHVASLAVARVIAKDGAATRFREILMTLLIGNALFATITTLPYVMFAKSRHFTACMDTECSWVNGAITWRGVQSIVSFEAIQIAINVAVVMIVALTARSRRGG
jgi:hypothetical protein